MKRKDKFGERALLHMEAIKGMTTRRSTIKIRDLVEGFQDTSNMDGGSVSTLYKGRLVNIRPKYQREYVVKNNENWRKLLLDSIYKKFGINRIILGVAEDGSYEVADGQQRLITILDFVAANNGFMIYNDEKRSFESLPEDVRNEILDYDIDVEFCIGTETERINYFQRINQPTNVLTIQELRNAVCTGDWLEDAKFHFVRGDGGFTDKENILCTKHYAPKADPLRQEGLEFAIALVSYLDYRDNFSDEDGRIRGYMFTHKNDENAKDLIDRYTEVIKWYKKVFADGMEYKDLYPTIRGLGAEKMARLYLEYKDKELNTKYITKRVHELVTMNYAFHDCDGAYEYVLDGERNLRFMTPRTFTDKIKQQMFKLQGGIDPISGEMLTEGNYHAHHIKSWRYNGPSNLENCILISEETHRLIHNGGIYTIDVVTQKRNELIKKNGYSTFF